MKSIVVFYHGQCPDGFGAAWIFWKKFKDRATYIPVIHGNPPPQGLKDKEIYFVDIAFELPIIKKLVKENKKVVILEHHISRAKEAKAATDYRFALTRSGVGLAWHYLFPKEKFPKVLKYIEETDLWNFKSRGVKEIFACLALLHYNFKVWDKFIKEVENPKKWQKFFEKGQAVLERDAAIIDDTIQRAGRLVSFAGYKVLAVNSVELDSEIGNAVAKGKTPPLGIIWYMRRDGAIKVSLRGNGKVNLAKLAEKYGGGGHHDSAGFLVRPGGKLPWKPL